MLRAHMKHRVLTCCSTPSRRNTCHGHQLCCWGRTATSQASAASYVRAACACVGQVTVDLTCAGIHIVEHGDAPVVCGQCAVVFRSCSTFRYCQRLCAGCCCHLTWPRMYSTSKMTGSMEQLSWHHMSCRCEAVTKGHVCSAAHRSASASDGGCAACMQGCTFPGRAEHCVLQLTCLRWVTPGRKQGYMGQAECTAKLMCCFFSVAGSAQCAGL
jgi:hypothetical protein